MDTQIVNMLATVAVAFATIVLAIITYLHLREIRVERKERNARYLASIKPDLHVRIENINSEKGPLLTVENKGKGEARNLNISVGSYKLPAKDVILSPYPSVSEMRCHSGRIYATKFMNVITGLKTRKIDVKIRCTDLEGNPYVGTWKDGKEERIKGNAHSFEWP